MDSVWTARRQRLAAKGLNAWGVADGSEYGHILPGCRSVCVLGSGGSLLWEKFREDLREHPQHLTEEDHPLDAFVARTLQEVDPEPGETRRWIRCASDEPFMLDFRPLALQAALGWRSMLGLLITPEFGPWFGLRAACFTTDELPLTGPLKGSGPCPNCTAPCISACPAGAMTRPPGDLGDLGGWDVQKCSQFHQLTQLCSTTCHSREACPEGTHYRYDTAQLRYHSNRAVGRVELAQSLKIADTRPGIGPFWGDWSSTEPNPD